MATTFVIACPDCSKQVKVSEEHLGKRVKCKGCGTVFPVKAADGSPPPPKKAGPPAVPKAASATAAPPPKEIPPDEEYDPNRYVPEVNLDTLPRCPFCAHEMASMEARICLNCGFDVQKRQRPEVRHIYAPTGVQIFLWLLPAIMTILVMIGMVVWYLFFWKLIEGWMDDSIFEDEKGPPKTFIAGLSPGMCRLYHALLIVVLYVPMTKFAYKRLIKNYLPPERKIKDD
jgi:predicted Zn finger-like uncharacterized protein